MKQDSLIRIDRGASQQGATLVEILLVLTIASILLYMGLVTFQRYRREQDIEQLKYTVNTLFQGLNLFYRANCIQFQTAAGWEYVTKPGYLDPNSNPPEGPPNPYSVPFRYLKPFFTYLPEKWPNYPLNPIVNNDDETLAYVTQFNLLEIDREVDTTTNPDTPSETTETKIGTIYLWKAQVAVRMQNPDTAKAYQYALGATCVSSLSGNIVSPCSANAAGAYVVWERLPSFVSPQTQETWQMRAPVVQFLQMYTTYPILNLTNGWTKDQYFLCGG